MPWNLIVVVFDTLRYDAVFGDLAHTPNLRRFAEQSTVFTNAWGEGLPTIPFRRSLHTGIRSFPWRYHQDDRGSFPNLLGWHNIPEAHTTAAEYLYNHGYATQLIADVWHMFKASQNFVRGFVSWDFIRGQEGDTYEISAHSFADTGTIDPLRVGPSSYLYQVRKRQHEDEYFVSQLFTRASQFITSIGSAGPYCLWVESFSPHEFWDPPLQYADAYFQRDGLKNYIVPQLLNRRPDSNTPSDNAPNPDDIARTKALYQGYCTFCDERFGRFLDTLEQTGALNNSVVAVLSDHGTELWDKGQFGKAGSRLYPYNTQINLMIRHPKGEGAGQHIDTFVQNHDILPTLLSLLNIPHPPLDGSNLWPLVSGHDKNSDLQARDHVIIGWDVFASIRDREWNLLINTTEPSHDLKLFHLSTDSTESCNVASQYPQVVTRQIARLEALLGAPLPATYQHRPLRNRSATPGGLRQKRSENALPGERWIGSNQA